MFRVERAHGRQAHPGFPAEHRTQLRDRLGGTDEEDPLATDARRAAMADHSPGRSTTDDEAAGPEEEEDEDPVVRERDGDQVERHCEKAHGLPGCGDDPAELTHAEAPLAVAVLPVGSQ